MRREAAHQPGDLLASVARPANDLKALEKVFLGRGERQGVSLELEERSFGYFRTEAQHWVV